MKIKISIQFLPRMIDRTFKLFETYFRTLQHRIRSLCRNINKKNK